jgi:phosphatidylglycerophosphatase A
LKALARLIATWFYVGYAPVAPGTVGSLAAVAIAFAIYRYSGFSAWQFLVLALLFLWPAIWSADVTARESGREDPGFIVVDEVVGQWITLAGATVLNWKSWLLAFALFRIFDIWKPPPVRQMEALHGGTGIVMDDVLAGVYGAIVLFAAGWLKLY